MKSRGSENNRFRSDRNNSDFPSMRSQNIFLITKNEMHCNVMMKSIILYQTECLDWEAFYLMFDM